VAPGQQPVEQPRGAAAPRDRAAGGWPDPPPVPAQVDIVGVEAEDVIDMCGGLVQNPPENMFPQARRSPEQLGQLAIGQRRRPLLAATLATFGYPVPGLLLALRAPMPGVAAGALVAGVGSALFDTFWTTTLQQQVSGELLARADSFVTFGAFGPGTAGLAAAGPAAAALGAGRVLGFGAAWATLSGLVVLALPVIRSLRWRPDGPGPASAGPDRTGPDGAGAAARRRDNGPGPRRRGIQTHAG
jgi:hypothetical protein